MTDEAFDYDQEESTMFDDADSSESSSSTVPDELQSQLDNDERVTHKPLDAEEESFDYDDEDDEDFEDDDSLDDDGESSSTDDDDADDDSGTDDGNNDTISQELIFEAANAGLTFEKIKSIKDPEALKTVIEFAKENRLNANADGGDEGKGEDEEEDAFNFAPLELPEDIDEDIADAMKGMLDKYNPQMEAMAKLINEQSKTLKQRETEVQKQVQEVAQQEFYRWYDSAIESLPEWQDVFGKGNIEALEESSKEAENRVKVVREMEAQLAAHPELASNRKKLLDMSLQLTFPQDKQTKEAAAKKKATDNHIQGRVTNRPAGKDKKSVSGTGSTKKKARSTALAAIKKYFK